MLENLDKVLKEISVGNDLGEKITLVGATKFVPVETINAAIKKGLKIVAENKVQEFREKTDKLDKKAEQHFIGHLQKNKVKYLVGKVALIQSVDTLSLAEEISSLALKRGVVQDILLEVNIGEEESKSGLKYDEVISTAQAVSKLKGVRLKG
ncbi:MAG: alanine racemase, partial [Clostridia bacterium]|nr:alanine racemase [Clostridia bacterium]